MRTCHTITRGRCTITYIESPRHYNACQLLVALAVLLHSEWLDTAILLHIL